MTDEFLACKGLNKEFANHQMVNQSAGEYVRGNVNTDTAEGFFAILKRVINGIYHHASNRYLCHYLYEFNFCYNE